MLTERDAPDDGGGVVDADRDAASRLLDRRRASLEREPDHRRRRQKAYALLARNGFGPDVCHEVAGAVIGPADDPSARGV